MTASDFLSPAGGRNVRFVESGQMNRDTSVPLASRLSLLFSKTGLSVISIVLCLSTCILAAGAQHAHPGRGAVSAQDLARMTAQATPGSDSADSVCARFAAGSSVSAPPELKSQNGVLEVTMQFLTVVDSQGLTRYCYVTSTGLEAPTLRVNPGDQLIIHFTNSLPAPASPSTGDN